MKKVKSVPSHLNHMFSELKPIWSVLGSQEPYCNSNVFDPIVHHIGSWYLQTALWLQYQKRFGPNGLYIGSSYSELLFWSFSFFPADGVSHMLSMLYFFKHWQKLGCSNNCNFKNFLTPMFCILEVHILNCCFAHFPFFLLMVFLICCQRSIFSSIDKSWDLQRSIDR